MSVPPARATCCRRGPDRQVDERDEIRLLSARERPERATPRAHAVVVLLSKKRQSTRRSRSFRSARAAARASSTAFPQQLVVHGGDVACSRRPVLGSALRLAATPRRARSSASPTRRSALRARRGRSGRTSSPVSPSSRPRRRDVAEAAWASRGHRLKPGANGVPEERRSTNVARGEARVRRRGARELNCSPTRAPLPLARAEYAHCRCRRSRIGTVHGSRGMSRTSRPFADRGARP
jgi:hypothetical protein